MAAAPALPTLPSPSNPTSSSLSFATPLIPSPHDAPSDSGSSGSHRISGRTSGNSQRSSLPSSAVPAAFTAHPSSLKLAGHSFPVTRQTCVAHVYVHDADAVIEYPHTEPKGDRGEPGGVAHVFPLTLSNDDTGDLSYVSPLSNLAYSRSDPSKAGVSKGKGGTPKKRTCLLFSSVLHATEEDMDAMSFIRSEFTCSGAKLCGHAARSLETAEHRYCTPELLRERVAQQRHEEHGIEEAAIPAMRRVLIEKTLALKSSLACLGCRCDLSADESQSLGLGSQPMRCPGRLVFGYDREDRPFVKCEFRTRLRPKHRFEQQRVMETDVGYLEALFNNDAVQMAVYEAKLSDEGMGPLPPCTFVAPSNVQRTTCPFLHRAPDGPGDQAPEHGKLLKKKCEARFVLFTPPDDYIERYPYAVLVCTGVHTHPLPLPTRTPEAITVKLGRLLDAMGYQLADVTPRRLMRHPAVGTLLRELVPGVPNPTLSDLHPSLANHDHVTALIRPVKKENFPSGTGWAGIQRHFEREQALPPDEQYIRRVTEFTLDAEKLGRFVLCMSQAQSERCRCALWRVSDISFKRAPPWYEFELGAWDYKTRRTDVFCRVFCNSKSAQMHFHILVAIEELVLQDTGRPVQWRHIHSTSIDRPVGTQGYSGDLDPGQIQGYGLLFRFISRAFPNKRDLHDLCKLLVDLTWQEHAHRTYRACIFHVFELIKRSAADDGEKTCMRLIVDGTKATVDRSLTILQAGSQPARDWAKNKIDSGFVLEGLCFEMNKIPADAWKISERTSGISESSHADINLEGKQLSLLSAVERGRRFDLQRTRSLEVLASHGIARAWIEMDAEHRITRSIKRSDKKRSIALAARKDRRTQLTDDLAAAEDRRRNAVLKLSRARCDKSRKRWSDGIAKADSDIQRLQVSLANLDAIAHSPLPFPTPLPSVMPLTDVSHVPRIAQFGLPFDMSFDFTFDPGDSFPLAVSAPEACDDIELLDFSRFSAENLAPCSVTPTFDTYGFGDMDVDASEASHNVDNVNNVYNVNNAHSFSVPPTLPLLDHPHLASSSTSHLEYPYGQDAYPDFSCFLGDDTPYHLTAEPPYFTSTADVNMNISSYSELSGALGDI